MNKQEVLDYVMHTPNNTNYSVLKGLLDDGDTPGPEPGPSEEIKMQKVILYCSTEGQTIQYLGWASPYESLEDQWSYGLHTISFGELGIASMFIKAPYFTNASNQKEVHVSIISATDKVIDGGTSESSEYLPVVKGNNLITFIPYEDYDDDTETHLEISLKQS